jgi:Ni/Co efflux regulator RcnB
MSKLLPVVVAAAFAAASFTAIAQDKKKQDVKSAQSGNVVTQDKKAVTTATDKPKQDAPKKAAPAPKAEPKKAAEAPKTELKSAQGGPVTTQDKKGVAAKSK